MDHQQAKNSTKTAVVESKQQHPIVYRLCEQKITIDNNYSIECFEQLLYSTHLALMRSCRMFIFMSTRPDYLIEECKSFINITWKVAINDDEYSTPSVITVKSKLKINTVDVKTWFETKISDPMINSIQSVFFKNLNCLQIHTITCIMDFEDFSSVNNL